MKRLLVCVLLAALSGCNCSNELPRAIVLPPSDGGHTGLGPVCEDELAYFDEHLWRPVMAVTCIGCHNDSGTAAHTRLLLKPPEEPDHLKHNFLVVRDMAREELAGISLLLLRPSGLHPDGHTGGKMVPRGSPHYTAFEGFVQRAKTEACEPNGPVAMDCTGVRPGQPQVRRLTHEEYNRTVRDLLGLDTSLGRDFAADTLVNGFTNNASSLRVSPLLVDQYRQAAEDLAQQVVARGLSSLLPCEPSGGQACAAQFIRTFGEKAFRRPLTATEQGRYQTLFQSGQAQGSFATGVEWVLNAFLQSPHFLYRTELGTPGDDGHRVLTPWELASELSYLLTGSMPDAQLMEAARTGALRTPEQLQAHALRLMQSPRAREVVARFTDAWLHTNRLEAVPKDSASYPQFSTDIRGAMREELARFVSHVVFDGNGTLTELLTAPYSFLDERLAQFYGVALPPGQTGFRQVPSASAHRRGVLTTGAVLSVHAKPNASSPVYRGQVVRERLLCQELAPPPSGIVAQPPPLDPTRSSRERYIEHSTVQPCLSCHRLMDPIGFAFDRFDGIGRLRDNEYGHPILDTGEIVGTPHTDTPFTGTGELASVLASSEDVQDCFALQWFRYGYGLSEDNDTQCLVRELQKGFRQNLNVRELMLALTRSPHFTTRTAADVPPIDGGVPGDGGVDAGVDAGLPPPSNVQVKRIVETDWGTGWCEKVIVTNSTSETVTWQIDVQVDGYIDQSWNSERIGSSGLVRFRGAQWNAQLRPSESTEFGFCALRGQPPADAGTSDGGATDAGTSDGGTTDGGTSHDQNGLWVTTIIGNDWGTGYCMDVTVKNNRTTAVEWSIQLDVEGTLYTSWECVHSTYSGRITFSGPAYAKSLNPGQEFRFGFCANR